jgi:hypothetical protein
VAIESGVTYVHTWQSAADWLPAASVATAQSVLAPSASPMPVFVHVVVPVAAHAEGVQVEQEPETDATLTLSDAVPLNVAVDDVTVQFAPAPPPQLPVTVTVGAVTSPLETHTLTRVCTTEGLPATSYPVMFTVVDVPPALQGTVNVKLHAPADRDAVPLEGVAPTAE